MLKELIGLATAYEEALEFDYCRAGEHKGMRLDEIAGHIIEVIRKAQSEEIKPEERVDKLLEACKEANRILVKAIAQAEGGE